MRIPQRLLAAFALALCTVGFVGCLAGVIGIWLVQASLIDRGNKVIGRIETRLGQARSVTRQMDDVLLKASNSLDEARAAPARPGQEDETTRLALKMAARKVRQEVHGQVEVAREQLQTVTEAAIVVNSILGDVNELPFVAVSSLDESQVKELGGRLGQVATLSQQLSEMLDKGRTPDDKSLTLAVPEHSSAVARTLNEARGAIGTFEEKVAEISSRVAFLKARFVSAVQLGAIVLTLVLLWIALSQASLFLHAWTSASPARVLRLTRGRSFTRNSQERAAFPVSWYSKGPIQGVRNKRGQSPRIGG